MNWVIGFGVLFALFVLWIVRSARRAGARELDPEALTGAWMILSVSTDSPGKGWQELGSLTAASGLNLKFDHDDDPQAEAILLAPGVESKSQYSTLANRLQVTLEADYMTSHVHTGGFVFRVRLRGTGTVVGRQVCILMVIDPKRRRPVGGQIENDDDCNPAVGDWIEIESAEILAVRPA